MGKLKFNPPDLNPHMKKKSTSQSAFFNLRVLLGLFLAVAGFSLLALNEFAAGTAPKGCGFLVGSGLTCGWPMNTWSAQLASNTVQYTFATRCSRRTIRGPLPSLKTPSPLPGILTLSLRQQTWQPLTSVIIE